MEILGVLAKKSGDQQRGVGGRNCYGLCQDKTKFFGETLMRRFK
jgi:hypothetical protein